MEEFGPNNVELEAAAKEDAIKEAEKREAEARESLNGVLLELGKATFVGIQTVFRGEASLYEFTINTDGIEFTVTVEKKKNGSIVSP